MAISIPVIIPTFNNPTYLKGMIDQLVNVDVHHITIIDNASTSLEMQSFLKTVQRDFNVIRLQRNAGPRYFRENRRFYDRLPMFFCVTDPDLAFNHDMPKNFLDEFMELSNRYGAGIVGLALDISDTDKMRDDFVRYNGVDYKIWEWESKFWKLKMGETSAGDPIYKADVDTTFALYNKSFHTQAGSVESIRVAGRYTCKHMPWYIENGLPKREADEYKATQRYSYYFSDYSKPSEGLLAKLRQHTRFIARYGLAVWFAEKLSRRLGMVSGRTTRGTAEMDRD